MNTTAITHISLHLTRQTRRWDRRLRLVRSLLLGPRAIIAGLIVGVIGALAARWRPWLLPSEIAGLTAGIIALFLVITLGAVWLWPHPVSRAARYFDHRFELKERTSTALELAAGVLPFPAGLAERQLADAVSVANRVNLRNSLPLRVRWGDLLAILLFLVLLGVLLLTHNPQADKLLAQRELQSAIDEQIGTLDETIQRIEENDALSAAEREELTQALREAREVLAQDGISQEEAVAAMAEAAQALKESADGMLADQEAAYQEAASSLAGSELTDDLAQALSQPNLSEAAEATEELAQQLDEQEQTAEELAQLAEQLEQAADALEENNPAVAQKLREAAEALREGDLDAAREALREASELMRRQQEQLQNSPLSEAAQEAEQQVREGQQQIAQAGQQQAGQPASAQQQPDSSEQPSGQLPGQPGQQEQNQGQSPSDQVQQSPQGDQQSGPGQSQVNQGQGEQGPSGQQASDSAEASESGGSSGQEAQQPGQGSEGESPSGSEGGDQQQGSTGSASVGSGEGGTGTDTIIGQQGDVGDTSEGPSNAESELQDYQAENAPTSIGGQSTTQVDIGGSANQADGVPIQAGEFGPNPSGQAVLSYTGVLGNYQGVVSQALESGRIPLDQRDVIHDYFSSLDR